MLSNTTTDTKGYLKFCVVVIMVLYDFLVLKKCKHLPVFTFLNEKKCIWNPVDDSHRDSSLMLPSPYLGLSVGKQRGGGGMAGEAARWRRGGKIRYRWEHQVHPPRSHPQADTQVTSPNTLCILKPIVWFLIILNFQSALKFSALFKLIQRWPWIQLCTWPNTSHLLRERRWCVSCLRWRHQHHPNLRVWSPPPWAVFVAVAHSSVHNHGCWSLTEAQAWNWGWWSQHEDPWWLPGY